MQTAVYLSNRAPHASLADETPYKALYGKDANLGYLRAIGARAFVHVETTPRNWNTVPGKDALSATVWAANLFGFTMHRKGV